MKKVIFLFCIAVTLKSFAQWSPGGTSTTANIWRTGNVGIGSGLSAAPAHPLVVNNSSGPGTKVVFGNNNLFSGMAAAPDACTDFIATAGNSYLGVYSGSSASANYLRVRVDNLHVNFTANNLSGSGPFPDMNFTTNTGSISFKIQADGKVVVGNPLSVPGTYKLYVQEGILTEKVKVAIDGTANWSDYVFASDYKLMPLEQVEKYIVSNKHLPGVISAEEVVKEGLDLGSMDAKLLEKIEELTLYVIKLNKELENLKLENSALNSKK
ncbi:MAG: hypothetical protein V4635_11620 [Bacteroidota bacterium]